MSDQVRHSSPADRWKDPKTRNRTAQVLRVHLNLLRVGGQKDRNCCEFGGIFNLVGTKTRNRCGLKVLPDPKVKVPSILFAAAQGRNCRLRYPTCPTRRREPIVGRRVSRLSFPIQNRPMAPNFSSHTSSRPAPLLLALLPRHPAESGASDGL